MQTERRPLLISCMVNFHLSTYDILTLRHGAHMRFRLSAFPPSQVLLSVNDNLQRCHLTSEVDILSNLKHRELNPSWSDLQALWRPSSPANTRCSYMLGKEAAEKYAQYRSWSCSIFALVGTQDSPSAFPTKCRLLTATKITKSSAISIPSQLQRADSQRYQIMCAKKKCYGVKAGRQIGQKLHCYRAEKAAILNRHWPEKQNV